MKFKTFLLTLTVISSFLQENPLALASERPPIFLKLGEQRLLALPTFERYSVSGSAIRYTRLGRENQLLVKGVSVGMSTLLLTHDHTTSTQTIRVEAKVDSPYPHPLFQSLNLLDEIEVIDGGTQFILRGSVNRLPQAQAISHLRQHFSSYIIDETRIDTEWLKRNILQISELLKPYPHLKLIAQEGALSVQGAVPNETALAGLTKNIRAIQPLTTFDFQTTKGYSPTLYFKVFLLEVKKEFTSKIGIEISQPITGSIRSVESILGNPVDYSIHALTEKGIVRVLSAPELVVKSPGQAELFAGGEMPIRLKNRVEDKIAWKNVGLSLKLDVKEYNGEKVRLTIETELNHLNSALSFNDVPGIKTNRIKTQVEGTMGKPLLLSGLLQEDTREKISGLTGLSTIPVLGKLFSSEDFQKDRSELVAVLLPYREPPREPLQRISSDLPKGYLPIPRNYISQDEVEKLQNSREYPWNVL